MDELLREAAVPPILIDEFFSLLQQCLSPNVCRFNNTTYSLPVDIGIPIGSPLGSLISEVFMEKFELQLFQSSHPLLRHVGVWRRYVDDILCVWHGPGELIEQFLSLLNSFFPSIKFTVEIGGAKINFLDFKW